MEHGHPAGHPTEVEPVECAKRRVVPTKCGHAAICKVREPTDSLDSLAHGSLGGGSGKVLRASGCALAGGRQGDSASDIPLSVLLYAGAGTDN